MNFKIQRLCLASDVGKSKKRPAQKESIIVAMFEEFAR